MAGNGCASLFGKETVVNAIMQVPRPLNEPVLEYRSGSAERSNLESAIRSIRQENADIPLLIGGREIRTGNTGECRIPHDHRHKLGVFHKAGPKEVQLAISESRKAWKDWSRTPWEERSAICLKAAEIVTKKQRSIINASTMVCQSKTVHQSEIDAVCEMADFLRMNTWFLQRILQIQPESFAATWNRMEYRALEGFVFAVSPFNFTSIGGNLCMAPALAGNTVLWKPASTAVYSNWEIMKALMEAGLPDGVVNFIPGNSSDVGPSALGDPHLAGVHFTGSNRAFNSIWKTVAGDMGRYRTYPRIVGETGGKDFMVAHSSADVEALAACLTRGAFEYQGQKCSATSRAYIPRTMWDQLRELLEANLRDAKTGPVEDFGNFLGAVIDQASYDSICSFIQHAESNPDCSIVIGGNSDDSEGYFIEPTVVLTKDPHCRLMEEEIFGPVLTVFLYDENEYEEVLELCDSTSPYALTGGVFATDRKAVILAEERLIHAAGNFYINDKTTGATVGHQPFGGARASGTNDKAGSVYNLLRWMSVRTLKECFNSPRDFRYPYMD
jgi:1-pyrroline-5-carboxylate dehydrogenase